MVKKVLLKVLIGAIVMSFALSFLSCEKNANEKVRVSIQLRQTTPLYLLKNETFRLKFDFVPDTADDPEVNWTSSDESIATVNEKGIVTAKDKVGRCTITVSTVDGTSSDKCEVNVSAEVTGMTLNYTNHALYKGDSFQLTAQVKPADADQSVDWSSDNLEVATIDDDGKVTAVKEGTAIITAKSKVNPALKATCKITVNPMTVILNYKEYSLLKGKTVTLSAKVEPDNNDQTVSWTSSDSKIASVSNGTVTAIAEGGPVTITATSKADPSSKATCIITVVPIRVSLNLAAWTTLKDETLKVKATVTPSSADQGVTWNSSNTAVATVQSDGTVKSISPGVAQITATSKVDNTKTASCTVTVVQLSIGLNLTKKDLYEGETFALTAIVRPVSCTDKIVWSSDDTSIATINNGTVKGIWAGKTTIRAKYKSTTYATCVVNVKKVENYVKSDYFEWDAYAAIDAPNGSAWASNSSAFHPGEGVTATISCKLCPTYEQMQMYLGAGVYWDDNGPAYRVNGGEIKTTGLWVKKKSTITGFNNNSAYKTTYRVVKIGKPNDPSAYFFLPAAGCYNSGFMSVGTSGLYWLNTSAPTDNVYNAYSFEFNSKYAQVKPRNRNIGLLRFTE